MKKLFLALLIIMGFAQFIFAHEGHDKMPGAVSAPHGGVVKGTDHIYLELVNESGGVKIYPLTHDLTPISLNEITIQATAAFPKKSKTVPVTFTQVDDHFSAKIETKGAYRYTLELSVTHNKKKEKVKFQVEPQE